MTRNRIRSATCLLSMKEPKLVKDALEDDNWYKDYGRRNSENREEQYMEPSS